MFSGASDPALTTCKVEVTVEDLNDVQPVFVKAPLANFIQVLIFTYCLSCVTSLRALQGTLTRGWYSLGSILIRV